MTTYLTRNRKPIRLGSERYAEPGAICSVTVAVQDRQPIFADPIVAAAAVEVLVEHAGKTGAVIYGYCVMPDHLHPVLGPSATCDIITFVGQYKNQVQRRAWNLGVNGSFWQKRFWDHFLRAEEQVEQTVQYVLNNPVRKGLVDEWSGYVFSGSLVFALGRESRGQAPTLRPPLVSDDTLKVRR